VLHSGDEHRRSVGGRAGSEFERRVACDDASPAVHVQRRGAQVVGGVRRTQIAVHRRAGALSLSQSRRRGGGVDGPLSSRRLRGELRQDEGRRHERRGIGHRDRLRPLGHCGMPPRRSSCPEMRRAPG
jgi:hypothetical protein